MDHIILPSGSSQNGLVKVPLLTSSDYNGENFEAYPEHQGWGVRENRSWRATFAEPTPEFLSFLQRWLFFGVLQTVLVTAIPIRDFRNDSSSRPLVTTRKLSTIMSHYQDRFKQNQKRECYEQLLRGVKSVALASRLLRAMLPENSEKVNNWAEQSLAVRKTLIDYITSFSAPDPMDPEISMSIHLVVEICSSLLEWSASLLRSEPGLPLLSTATDTLSPPASGQLWALLTGNGWCASDMHIIFNQFNTSGLLFLNSLTAPGSCDENQIKSAQQLQDHHACRRYTHLGCALLQISEDSYKRRHIQSCCGDCGEFRATPDKILNNGFIPLIKVINTADRSGEIELVAAEPESQYIGISHVWSDGLGNPKCNSIPYCQMVRLSDLVQRLPGDHSNIRLFWLDTICVPRNAGHSTEAKKTALLKMRQTYENATAVLVLDSWLSTDKLQPKPDVDNLMKIFVCRWNRRLWTLQEGSLARRLYFQFADGVYDLDQGIEHLNEADGLILKCTLKPTLNAQYIALRGIKRHWDEIPLQGKMLSVLRTTRYRSTSYASDEALCLASICGFDTGEIIKLQDESKNTEHLLRMRCFWGMAKTVPRALVFYVGETLDFEGFRWAPRTLLRSKSNMLAIEDQRPPANIQTLREETGAYPIPEGLLTEASGLIFPWQGIISLLGELSIMNEDGSWYTFKPHLPELLGHPEGTDLVAVLRRHIDPLPNAIALIFEDDEEGAFGLSDVSRFVLAGVARQEDGIIFVRKICIAHGKRLEVEDDQERLTKLQIIEALVKMGKGGVCRDSMVARRKPPKQLWCVD